MVVYDFDEQLREGLEGERLLDAYFSRWFDITPASRQQQREGIDRTFVNRESGATWLVEYKMDKRAHQTGNAFVEIVSVRRPGHPDKPGWAYSSQSDRLLYYIPTDELVYIFTPDTLRNIAPTWEQRYRTRDVQNRNYVTVGILVPLSEFEEYAMVVISL